MLNPVSKSTPRENRTIVVPFDQDKYPEMILKPDKFRAAMGKFIEHNPELFPPEISLGYLMKDIYHSKKLSILIRRIEVAEINYTVRPCFAMPYLTGFVDDVEKALFLRKFDVPFWALSYVFGKDHMYWYRLEQSLGRNSIVGTTIKAPEFLPEHLAADEKHTRIKGEKAYVATTVGNQCILGASVAEDAGGKALKKAYGIFKDEAQYLDHEYSPKSVNTDGWKATINAWKALFPFIAIICCFLHVFLKIRDRCSKKYKDLFPQVADKFWNCYKATSKRSFSQQVRRLYEWSVKTSIPDVMLHPIKKLRENLSDYAKAYDLPGAHRTSNMVDRLMKRMDRHLFTTCYFHGSISSAELNIRGWVLIHNFAPSNPLTIKKHSGLKSPAERLNKFCYHDNWLKNLLLSASLGGFRSPPLKLL